MFDVAAPGVSGETLQRELAETKRTTLNAIGGGRYGRTEYLRWATVEVGRLTPLLTPEALNVLVTTPRYWAILALDAASNAEVVNTLVSSELQECHLLINSVFDAVASATRYWHSRPGRYVVADTNVFLHHKDELDQIDWRGIAQARQHEWAYVVVPMVVVDELDGQKRKGQGPQRTRARAAISRLNEFFEHGNSYAVHRDTGDGGGLTFELLVDDPSHLRLPHADSEIVAVTRRLQDFSGHKMTLATFDTGMAFRARIAELAVDHLSGDLQSQQSR